ncbi:hypothetical protein KIL84_005385 [Mauremys mutica]|uniref:Uncharacterized protein n=1 Tax=Mauremys mutica TaxID=74926 RepID=A0A9D3XHN4_9SAUR|nr:hypothetical protein KIL84_005385 [Mauremys mutica]
MRCSFPLRPMFGRTFRHKSHVQALMRLSGQRACQTLVNAVCYSTSLESCSARFQGKLFSTFPRKARQTCRSEKRAHNFQQCLSLSGILTGSFFSTRCPAQYFLSPAHVSLPSLLAED